MSKWCLDLGTVFLEAEGVHFYNVWTFWDIIITYTVLGADELSNSVFGRFFVTVQPQRAPRTSLLFWSHCCTPRPQHPKRPKSPKSPKSPKHSGFRVQGSGFWVNLKKNLKTMTTQENPNLQSHMSTRKSPNPESPAPSKPSSENLGFPSGFVSLPVGTCVLVPV